MTSGGAILRHSISKISGEYFIVKFHCSLSQFEQFLTSTKDAIDFASAVPDAYNILRWVFSVQHSKEIALKRIVGNPWMIMFRYSTLVTRVSIH